MKKYIILGLITMLFISPITLKQSEAFAPILIESVPIVVQVTKRTIIRYSRILWPKIKQNGTQIFMWSSTVYYYGFECEKIDGSQDHRCNKGNSRTPSQKLSDKLRKK